MPRSTIIIPVFNHAALTKVCLETVIATSGSPHSAEQAEIVVVDDGSTDATRELLTSFSGRIKVVAHNENLGFAASCNDAAAVATGDYLIFLNNDTIPQPGWLEALEGYADKHQQAAVVGARLLYPDRTIQHAGVVICQDRYPRHIYTGFPDNHPAVSKSRRFQIVTAACMLVRRPVFEAASGFDTAFCNGFEDVDFCLRLDERGHEIHYCAASAVIHLESVSVGRFKRDRGNVALYRKRWWHRVQPDDVRYYSEDGLMTFDYEGHYPFNLRVSPLLATLDETTRRNDTEILLRERSRHIAELQRENVRLNLALGSQEDAPALRYRRLRQQIKEMVQQHIPAGSVVLVISKGDRCLVDLPGCKGWHFPQTDRGAYAGHYPSDSNEAIEHLEILCAKGAQYLVIPATALWWQEHYSAFNQHLQVHSVRVAEREGVCAIHKLQCNAQPNGLIPALSWADTKPQNAAVAEENKSRQPLVKHFWDLSAQPSTPGRQRR